MTVPMFLTVLRRRFRLVVAILVLAVGAAVSISLLTTPTYEAKATLYFSVRTAAGVDDLSNGATFSRDQMASFATLAVTPAVLEPVAAQVSFPGGATALSHQVSATAANDTVLMTITVTDTDAERATTIANAVAQRTITVVENVSPTDPAGGDAAMKVTVVMPASVPTSPSSPVMRLNVAAGALLGLALGVLLALAREAFDTRVHGAAEVARLTSRPVIGALGTDPAASRRVAVETEPQSPQAEAYRQLRTSLQFLHAGELDSTERRRVLAVTSSVAGEGKSTVTVNLGLALARTGARVLVVDADLRRPSVARMLGLEGAAGLTTVLLGDVTAADVIQEWGTTGLRVLTAGVVPPNPTELLGSPAMRRLLTELSADHDFVLVDSAPLLPVADGAVLSRLVDGAIVVANVTKVRQQQLEESLRSLDRVEAPVLGIVLNQVARDESTYEYRAREDGAGRRPGWRRRGGRGRPGATAVPAPAGRARVGAAPVAPAPVAERESPVAARR